MVSRGDEIELRIESTAFEGGAVARLEGLVFFVPFGVPGDLVRARVRRKKKKFAEAEILDVLEPSGDRVKPRCRYFGICGGCRLQNIHYPVQLEAKRQQVRDLFQRIGHLGDCSVAPVIPSPSTYFYRNKMEFSFGTGRWLTREEIESGEDLPKGFALGLHIPGRFDRILDLEECWLQSRASVEIVNRVRQTALQNRWSAYHPRKNTGYLRNLIIRTGMNTDEIAVNLVTTRYESERADLILDRLADVGGNIVAFSNTVNGGRSPVARPEDAVHLLGDGTYRERIGEFEFQVGPSCFFQPNPAQAENLFRVVEEFARLDPECSVVYDLFCGVGAIGLFLAPRVRRVVGIESHPESIRFAWINAELNRASNCTFQVGDASEALQEEFLQAHGVPDTVVLDPPRAGLHPRLSARLLEVNPLRIVYTSCNPATQARDLAVLKEKYEVESIQPVDMFPQTDHIETVIALKRPNDA